MGQFAIVISGMGGHGCDRAAKDGENVLGCQRPDCPDCIAREVVRRLKRNGVQELRGELIHWPEKLDAPIGDDEVILAGYASVKPQGSSVIDNLVTGVRAGSF